MKKAKKQFIKRAIILQIILCMIFTVVPFEIFSAATEGYAGGTGSSTDPYLISNKDELLYFAKQVNSSSSTSIYAGKYFQLTDNIKFNDTSNWEKWDTSAPAEKWTPIGYYKDYNNRRSFAGMFDGNGYTISGLYANNSSDTYGSGFFGYIGGSSTAGVKNLNIEKSYLIGKGNVGGIAGVTDFSATFDSCNFDGNVLANGNFAGGLIGHYYGNGTTCLTVKNCVTSGQVKTTGVILGGLIGYTDSQSSKAEITDCYSTSKIISNDKRMGGLVGRFDDGAKERTLTISRCFFAGSLGDLANGTLVGEVGWSTLVVNDSFYNSSVIGGANGKVIQGTGKTTDEFKNNTVTNLLNTAADNASDLQKWIQGEDTPILLFDRCKLTDLVIDKCNFEFIPTTTVYDLSVSNKTDSIKITTYASGYVKSIKINGVSVLARKESGAIDLAVGENTVKVEIATVDSNCEYILNITRREKKIQEGVWDGTVAEEFAGGTGTEDDPYLISKPSQLALLEKQVNENESVTLYYKKYFKLTNDIYLNDVSEYAYWNNDVPDNIWTPIGSYKNYSNRKSFGGILDGNGYTIYGLYTDNDSNTGTGLFGYIGGGYGEIKNLKIEKSYLIGNGNVGSFAGYTDYGTIFTNCEFSGTVISKGNYTGGFIGHYLGAANTKLTLTSCSVNGNVTSKGVITGGLIGYTDGNGATADIDNCYCVANVSSDDFRTGGFVGRLDDGSNKRTLNISRSYYYGTLGNTAAGTLAGQTGSSVLNTKDVFYNSDKIGGASAKAVQGIGKATEDFKNSTVCDILNSSILAYENLPNWKQDTDYPTLLIASAKLSNIKLSDGDIEFNPSIFEYKCSLPNKVQKITVTSLTSGYIKSVYVNNTSVKLGSASNYIYLNEGNNVITVTSVSVYGDKLDYVINIDRRKASSKKNVWNGSVAKDFAGGTGTESDPYLISSASQLALLAKKVNDCTTVTYAFKKQFKLTTDIYLNDISDCDLWGAYTPDNVWTPIGYYNKYSDRKSFGGVLNGDGHTIYGLYVNNKNSAGGAGLFGYIGGGYGEIVDLTIDKSYITGKSNVGSFAGYMDYDTKILNCSFSGTVLATENYAGGLLGHYIGVAGKKLIINSCYTSGNVTAKGYIAGGLFGYQDGKGAEALITNCYSSMSVSSKDFKTGGFVGRLDDSSNERTLTIEKSHFSGTLADVAKNDLVGENVKSTLMVKDTYVNYDNLKSNASLTYQGISKTSSEFSNKTVTELLNKAKSSEECYWEWFQGKYFPVEKKARLKSLKTSIGGIKFSPSVYEYSMSVSNRAESVYIIPTTAKNTSTVSVNGKSVKSGSKCAAIPLTVGKKVKVTVNVSDKDGSKSTYVIYVLRKKITTGPSFWDGTVASGFDYGTGTEDDPYIIATADELAYLAYSVNTHTGSDWSTAYSSKDYFVLENDIILNSNYADYKSWGSKKPKNEWTPIGTFPGYSSQATFAGNFDGGCHTIYGIYTNTSGSGGSGLFGAVNGSIVSNVFVKNSYISADSVAGGIVGISTTRSRATLLQNVSFSGMVVTKGDYAGGLIGKTSTCPWAIVRIDSSYSEGQISGKNHIGGIVGGYTSTSEDHETTIISQINNSYSGCRIDGKNYCGGLVGSFSGENPKISLKIRRSHFAGHIYCSSSNKGAILGKVLKNTAEITVQNDVYYPKDCLSGSSTKQYDAVALARKQFEDNTLLDLLNSANISPSTDLWTWIEGDKYPVSPYASLALTNIVLSSGKLVFDPSIFAYSVLVDKSVKSVTATAYTADEKSTLKINGDKVNSGSPSRAVDIKDGEASKFEIEVTKPNGKKQTFSVNVVRERYMLYCVGGNGVKNGEFGQEIYVDSKGTYTFSFKYYLKVANGLRPLVKYSKKGQNYLENVKPTLTKLDRKECELVYTFKIPDDAVVKDGKTLIKVGIKKDEESAGYISDFKLCNSSSSANLLVNPDFEQNFFGWMDQKYATYTTDNVFIGVRGEVELVPYVAKYFVKKQDDSNDKIFDDGDWASAFEKGKIETAKKIDGKTNTVSSSKDVGYLPWIIIPSALIAVGAVIFIIYYKKHKNKKNIVKN